MALNGRHAITWTNADFLYFYQVDIQEQTPMKYE